MIVNVSVDPVLSAAAYTDKKAKVMQAPIIFDSDY